MPASAARAVADRGQRVGQDRQPQPVRLGRGRGERRGVVLLRARVGGRRVAAARGHELDRVDAGLLRLADARDDGVGRVGLGTQEPVVPGGGRDRRPDDQQARPGDDAIPRRGPDREGHVQPAAGVARGRRAGQQQGAHRRGRADERALDRLGPRDRRGSPGAAGKCMWMCVSTKPGSSDTSPRSWTSWVAAMSVGSSPARPTDAIRPSTTSIAASASQPSVVAFATRAARTSCRDVMEASGDGPPRRRPADRVTVPNGPTSHGRTNDDQAEGPGDRGERADRWTRAGQPGRPLRVQRPEPPCRAGDPLHRRVDHRPGCGPTGRGRSGHGPAPRGRDPESRVGRAVRGHRRRDDQRPARCGCGWASGASC